MLSCICWACFIKPASCPLSTVFTSFSWVICDSNRIGDDLSAELIEQCLNERIGLDRGLRLRKSGRGGSPVTTRRSIADYFTNGDLEFDRGTKIFAQRGPDPFNEAWVCQWADRHFNGNGIALPGNQFALLHELSEAATQRHPGGQRRPVAIESADGVNNQRRR